MAIPSGLPGGTTRVPWRAAVDSVEAPASVDRRLASSGQGCWAFRGRTTTPLAARQWISGCGASSRECGRAAVTSLVLAGEARRPVVSVTVEPANRLTGAVAGIGRRDLRSPVLLFPDLQFSLGPFESSLNL